MVDNLQSFLIVIVIFTGIIVVCASLYSQLAGNYAIPVDSHLNDIQTHANETFKFMETYAVQNTTAQIQRLNNDAFSQIVDSVAGVLNSLGSLGNMVWGVLQSVFAVPQMLMSIITDTLVLVGIPAIFGTMIFVIISLFIVFEIMSRIR